MTILFSDLISGEECFSDTLEIFDGSSSVFFYMTFLCSYEKKTWFIIREFPYFIAFRFYYEYNHLIKFWNNL